jgi:phosphate transport system substrate-binding protein
MVHGNKAAVSCTAHSEATMHRLTMSVAAAALCIAAGDALARDQIRIVGSSTVFPFSTAVAEQYGARTGQKTPVVESTGSGGGIKLFCEGVGEATPDITNSSRRIKASEVEACGKNGVAQITEVKIGFDGIVVANSKAGPKMAVSIPQLWQALAKEVPQNGQLVANPYKMWSEIDPSLPAETIEVLGPPPTSGTRDAFVELVMAVGCEEFPEVKALKGDAHTAACHTVREDGAWIDAGENDNLIVQKLEANPNAFGVFGYSFLDQNIDKLQGSTVNGAEPTFEAIADGSYPVSRSLYFYVKNAHVGVVPGIKEYVEEFTSESAIGEEGYLADKGLIPLPEDERRQVAEQAASFTPLSM